MLVKLTDQTTDIPLQALNFDPTFPSVGTTTTVIGYGKTTDGGNLSNSLLKVDVDVASFELCDGLYGKIIDVRMLFRRQETY